MEESFICISHLKLSFLNIYIYIQFYAKNIVLFYTFRLNNSEVYGGSLRNLKIELSYDPTIPLLCIYPERTII